MTVAKLLIDTENGQEFRNIYFNENNVDGIYVIDSETMGVIIHGADFIMSFDSNIFERIKSTLELKTLGFN